MGEGGFRTGGEHSRHPFSVPANASMAKSEHAAMQRYETPSSHTVSDQAPAEADLDELPPRKDPVLTFG
jgi:hypothetical protein